jgi:hypothetical protein
MGSGHYNSLPYLLVCCSYVYFCSRSIKNCESSLQQIFSSLFNHQVSSKGLAKCQALTEISVWLYRKIPPEKYATLPCIKNISEAHQTF